MDACIERLDAAVQFLERHADDAPDAAELMRTLVPLERRLVAARSRLASRGMAKGAAARPQDKDAASWVARHTGTSKAAADDAAGGPLALWNAQFLCTFHPRLKSAGRLDDLPPPPAARQPGQTGHRMDASRAPT